MSGIGDECPRYDDEYPRYDDECPWYDDECPNSMTTNVVNFSLIKSVYYIYKIKFKQMLSKIIVNKLFSFEFKSLFEILIKL